MKGIIRELHNQKHLSHFSFYGISHIACYTHRHLFQKRLVLLFTKQIGKREIPWLSCNNFLISSDNRNVLKQKEVQVVTTDHKMPKPVNSSHSATQQRYDSCRLPHFSVPQLLQCLPGHCFDTWRKSHPKSPEHSARNPGSTCEG
jgi:hypothetical protein